jgi:hypothetical protein
MTSPANYNRYKEISRPNVNKIVKLGMAFRGTYGRSSWCVWERESGDEGGDVRGERGELGKGGVRERRGMVREEKVEGGW